MGKLSKSLSELDAMADEMLKKSMKKSAEAEDNDELEPEDVSENVPDEEVQETDETQDKEDEAESGEKETSEDTEKEEVKKSETDLEKCADGGASTKIAKSEDEPDAEEDSAEDESDETAEKEELQKSFQSTFEENPEIHKSIDASEFLSAVTEILSKSMADVCYDLRRGMNASSDNSDVLAKSLQASLQLNKAMSEEIDVLKAQNDELKSQNAELKEDIQKSFADFKDFMEEKFDDFSRQPSTMRKSLASVNVHERNFQKSLDTGAGMQLSKSEVLAKMSNMVMQGNPIVTSNDIISYESGAPLRPEVAQLINNG